MRDNKDGSIPDVDARARTRPPEPETPRQSSDSGGPVEGRMAECRGAIAVIESRLFLRECIRQSMQSAFSQPVMVYSTTSEFERQLQSASIQLVILSLTQESNEEVASECKVLSELLRGTPIIVLAHSNDADLARTTIQHGAKGYIPWTTGFEIAVAAARFVLAGGTYVPADIALVETRSSLAVAQVANKSTASGASSAPAMSPPGSRVSIAITGREHAVIRAVQQGYPNKLIAYHLNMCESTVKVHLRNIMKKLSAKNRTEVALRAQNILNNNSGISTDAAAQAA